MKPVTMHWPLASTTSIALLQSLAAAGTVVLNGEYGTAGFTTARIDDVLFRQVSITSANNLSGVNFTITGLKNGVPTTEVLAGPNANTVYSVNAYSVITSITTNAAAAAFSIGTGLVGATTPQLYDYQVPFAAMGIQTVVGGTTMNYTFSVTLAPIELFLQLFPIAGMTAATTNQFATYNTPVRYYWFNINATTTADATLTAYIVQQGL